MIRKLFLPVALATILISCNNDDDNSSNNGVLDPDTAPKASIDRFSDAAGNLMKRSENSNLPEVNESIDFDSGEPFITEGLAPDGSMVKYYNFDVQTTDPAPIYLFSYANEESVENQLNVVGVIPGDTGYNDFWQIYNVTVPNDYVVNSVTSEDELMNSGYTITATSTVVNCPIVPDNSTATKRVNSNDTELHRGWYKDQVVYYFSFFEKILDGGSETNAMVPLSPIYVTFNENGNAASGFVTEMGTSQTHNVIATVPADNTYSPLWSVVVYDNADFNSVNNLSTAAMANILATGVATVNCPVVEME